MSVVGSVNKWLDTYVILPFYSLLYTAEPETGFDRKLNELVKNRYLYKAG